MTAYAIVLALLSGETRSATLFCDSETLACEAVLDPGEPDLPPLCAGEDPFGNYHVGAYVGESEEQHAVTRCEARAAIVDISPTEARDVQ